MRRLPLNDLHILPGVLAAALLLAGCGKADSPLAAGGHATITIDLLNGTQMEMVWIPPGSFTMGTSYFLESHEVTITEGFYISRQEITNGQWEAVVPGVYPMPDNPAAARVGLTWYDVDEFMNQLNQAAGRRIYRMPTEAEWEFACQSGVPDDMAEGAQEWCWDRFGKILSSTPRSDPTGPVDQVDGRNRVARGLSGSIGGHGCAARASIAVNGRTRTGGRLVMEADGHIDLEVGFRAPEVNVPISDGPRLETPAGTVHEMISVPADSFVFYAWERQVHLDSFLIDRFEVTNAQFEVFEEASGTGAARRLPAYKRLSHRDQPVAATADAARAYCDWAGLRLPRETEWEFAALGHGGGNYPWGNAPPDCDRAVISTDDLRGRGCGVEGPWPVGPKAAGVSPLGVYNMAGNVSEWVDNVDANGNTFFRAGNWRSRDTRTTARMWTGGGSHGFRCAVAASPKL